MMKKFKVTIQIGSHPTEQLIIECTDFIMEGEYALFKNETKLLASFYNPLAVVEKESNLISKAA